MLTTRLPIVLATVPALMIGFSAPAIAQSYTIAVLTPPNSVETFLYGAGGTVAVGAASFLVPDSPIQGARTVHAMLWNNVTSTYTDLHPPGFSASYAFAARNGHQVGYGFISDENKPLLWTGTAASVVDLSSTAIISGTLTDTDGVTQVGGAITASSDGSSVAHIWQGTPESVQNIHPSELAESYAYAIRDGRIVGTGADFDFFQIGIYWPSSSQPAVTIRPEGFEETALQDLVGPWAVGSGVGPATGGRRHAYLWNAANPAISIDIHPTSNPAYVNSYPVRARRTGPGDNDFQLVGSVAIETFPGSGETDEHACLWIGPTTFIDLHTYVPAGFVLSKATGIDDAGNIYGWATDLAPNNSSYIALRWSPVTTPQPCSASDVAGPNQAVGADGSLTADDIIVFLGWYFASDVRADVAGPNQSTTPDASFTADDIIVFLGRYFTGC